MTSRLFTKPLAAAVAALTLGLLAAPAWPQATALTIALPDIAALVADPGATACSRASTIEATACTTTAVADYLNALAGCINLADPGARQDCVAEAGANRTEAEATCVAQAEARAAVCRLVGDGPFDPQYVAADFVDPRAIGLTVDPNRYFPLVPGTQWTYVGTFVDDEGDAFEERIVVTVTDRLKLIDGVLAVVVNDRVTRDGEVHEDTDDWYAQDRAGNVWYFGEEVKNYEVNEGDIPARPELVDMDGTWKAGVDGARPGIAMAADPVAGTVYRQEFGAGGPQDVAEVMALDATEAVPAAACAATCLVTREWTPVEPGKEAAKYYAPGIGLILELEGDVRVELVAFTRP